MKKLLLPASLALLIAVASCSANKGAENNTTKSENPKVVSPDNKEAPTHDAPNQAEIDSLKNERAKEKKGED